MRLVLLALRNLGRNRRRTIITGLAVAFGATAIVFLQGFVRGFIASSIENAVLSKLGAVQVFKHGYLGADDPLKVSLPDDPALVARIRGVDGVTAVAPRIDFDGLVSNGADSTMFVATAIDPRLEPAVCPKRPGKIGDGEALLGRTLAEALGARPGSSLVMQSAGPHAGSNALDVAVAGFLPSFHIAESKRLATVTLPFAQSLLRMKGRVTEYVVNVADLDRVEQVAARLRAQLGDGYDVTTWRELDPMTRDRARVLGVVMLFIALVLFLLVATGIVNTTLMSVYERVREIGTMLAVGVRRRQVTALFLWEAIALGLLSAALGTGVGWAVVRRLGAHGLTMHPPGGDELVIRPSVSLEFLAAVVGFSVAGTMLAALYPAWKASRLRPAEALRANRREERHAHSSDRCRRYARRAAGAGARRRTHARRALAPLRPGDGAAHLRRAVHHDRAPPRRHHARLQDARHEIGRRQGARLVLRAGVGQRAGDAERGRQSLGLYAEPQALAADRFARELSRRRFQ
jgi:putative ABC transport system permease protein